MKVTFSKSDADWSVSLSEEGGEGEGPVDGDAGRTVSVSLEDDE